LNAEDMARWNLVNATVEGARGVYIAKTEVLGDVVQGQISTDPGQAQQGRNFGGKGDLIPTSGPIEGTGSRGIPGQPEGLALLLPEREAKAPIDLAQQVHSALGKAIDQLLQSAVIEPPIEDQNPPIMLQGLAGLAGSCAKASMDQDGRAATEAALIIPTSVGDSRGELVSLVPVRRAALEVNDACDAAQGWPSTVCGVRADGTG